jgi:hypothetical protein
VTESAAKRASEEDPAGRALAVAALEALRENPTAAFVELHLLHDATVDALGLAFCADGNLAADCGLPRHEAGRMLTAALRGGCSVPVMEARRALHVRDLVMELSKDAPPRCYRDVTLALGTVPRTARHAACLLIAGRRPAVPPTAFPCVAELHGAEDVQRVTVGFGAGSASEDAAAPLAAAREKPQRAHHRAELVIEAVASSAASSADVFRARLRLWRGCRLEAAHAAARCL